MVPSKHRQGLESWWKHDGRTERSRRVLRGRGYSGAFLHRHSSVVLRRDTSFSQKSRGTCPCPSPSKCPLPTFSPGLYVFRVDLRGGVVVPMRMVHCMCEDGRMEARSVDCQHAPTQFGREWRVSYGEHHTGMSYASASSTVRTATSSTAHPMMPTWAGVTQTWVISPSGPVRMLTRNGARRTADTGLDPRTSAINRAVHSLTRYPRPQVTLEIEVGIPLAAPNHWTA
jgi:hypothetical protein